MPLPTVATLRRFDARGWELWLVPALAGAGGWATMASAGADLDLLRGLVFIGGPLLLLSGLHSRLDGYLHARARHQLLPLPLPPVLHWRAAAGLHRRGLVWTGLWGLAAVGGAVLGAELPLRLALGLVGDLAWLWLMALLLEPIVPAAGAWYGRRFDEDAPERRWQRMLGGGWTLPEAVVHLYAPAVGVASCAVLAMPGQLWLDRRVEGLANPDALTITAAITPIVALFAGRLAFGFYARGLFGAVPWVHEATRTLAGPPVPEAVPRWLLWGRDPVRHLVIRQFWRTTPVPGLRLGTLVAGTAWLCLAARPSAAGAATLLALSAVWLVPGVRVVSLAAARARQCAALPLPAPARAGRSGSAWAVLGSPVVVAVAAVALAWSTGA